LFRLNVPENPSPEAIDYAKFRAILDRFVTEMDVAEAALAAADDATAKLPVDMLGVGFDFNSDGKRGADESLAAVLTGMLPMPASADQPSSFLVNFDQGDFLWMRGYGRLTSAFAQFLLAHDFEDMFNATFHTMFPKAGLPLGNRLAELQGQGLGLTGSGDSDAQLADVIAMLHLIRWNTVEPARLADVRLRLKAVSELSPKSWAAIRAETDNDREWMPGPKQTQALTGSSNTDDQINGWLAVMSEFGAILDGEKRLPHWRFSGGMNVKRFFETSPRFDLLLMITGTDFVPYVEAGPTSDSARWTELMRAFNGNFLGFAFWYN
jgi:hypothetical protein